MKKIINIAIIALIINIFTTQFSADTAYAYTVSHGECVMEVNSGRILSSVNLDKKLPMASTTKILTALTVIENFDINKEITVPKVCVGVEGSSIYLREGEKLTVKELLLGLMLRSGNDCAECLAQTLVPRAEFIKLMNETAKKCGAINSNFTNPHGLPDENHYTTAYDLCKISCYAIKNPIFKEISSTKRVKVSNDGYAYDRLLINKNKLLFSYEGCTGIKTGYTKKAGRCLVTSAERDGLDVVSVVINSPQMWERSRELLDQAFNNYDMVEILNKDEFNDKIYHTNDGKPYKFEIFNSFVYPLTKAEQSEIKFKFNGKKQQDYIKKPSKEGIFEIFLQNELIFSQNIYTIIGE